MFIRNNRNLKCLAARAKEHAAQHFVPGHSSLCLAPPTEGRSPGEAQLLHSMFFAEAAKHFMSHYSSGFYAIINNSCKNKLIGL